MGRQRGVEDAAFRTHEAYYQTVAGSGLCDALFIENVPEYRVGIIKDELGPGWELKYSILDPRAFGIPAARTLSLVSK